MAKQHPDNPQKKKPEQHDDADDVVDSELIEASSPKKTHLGKKPPPTMLAPGAKAQDTPPKPPKVSSDVYEKPLTDVVEAIERQPISDAVEAQAIDSGVVEVQPVSDVVMAQPASDVVMAQPVSDVVMAQPASDALEAQPVSDVVEAISIDSGVVEAEPAADDEDVLSDDAVDFGKIAPDTPVRAEDASNLYSGERLGEDAVGDLPTSRAESSVRVRGPKSGGPKSGERERTEPFDLSRKTPEDLDDTVGFDDVDDDSSAVDLGAKALLKKGSSHHGVDEVAEALESGVDLKADSPLPHRPEPSVEFDDLFAEGAASDQPSSMKNRRREEAAISKDADAAEEAAAADLLSADETEKAAADEAPVSSKKIKAAAEKEAVEAAAEAPPPARKKKSGGTAVMTKTAPKPNYGRRLAGGMVLGTLLGVAVIAGVRYYDPELLEQGFGMVGAPAPKQKAQPQPQPPVQQLTPAQRAHDALDQGDYAAALELLKSAEETPGNLTARAQAAWLKYQKEQAEKKADLNAEDPAVKEVLADLTKANNDTVKSQVLKALEHKSLSEQVAGLKASEQAMNELRDILAKENIKADVKELPKALRAALTSNKGSDALLQGMQKALVDAKLLAENGKLDPAAFGKIVKDMGDKQAALAAVNKALEDAKIADGGAKGVEQLLTAKADLDGKLTAINKALADQKIKDEGAKGVQELLKVRSQLQKDRDELDMAIKAAHKELADAQLVPAGGDPRQQVLAGAKAARQRTESPLAIPLTQLAATLGSLGLNPAQNAKASFESAARLAELNFYRLREPLIQSPEQRLDAYLIIFRDRSRTDAKEHAAPLRDAAWVLSKPANASATAKAKAQTVTGLILRNQEKYAEAKQALEAAVAAPVPSPGPWQDQAKQALAELTNPASFYLPRIDQLQAGGQYKSAQEEINAALKVMPDDPRLLAQRALLRLDEERGAGKIAADAQAAIRKDAAVALKSAPAAAEGAYALGLLEEEIGNYAQAEKLFRQALKAHQGGPEDAYRYRIALARVLQRDRGPAVAPQPAPKKQEKKPADADAAGDTGDGDVSQAFPLALSLVLAQAGDDEEDPATAARLKESIDLAKALIDSPNPKIKGQGYMLLGQALARQGKRTEGMREYLKGMDLFVPGMAGKEMAKLLDEHPAFQQPDAAKAPSAYLAEVHFGKGLHLYWVRQYPEAEAHFKQAVGYFGQDARYQYFLGLSQYAQKTKAKRDAAIFSFEQGARLEANNRPTVSEINASMERVQGDVRKLINGVRAKAVELRN